MVSKVIAWGQDRTAALDTLDAALAGYTALGIDTNVEYLRLLINDADVRAGRLDTGLIERKMPDFTFRRAGRRRAGGRRPVRCCVEPEPKGRRRRVPVGHAATAGGSAHRRRGGSASGRRTAGSPPWR